MKPRSYLGIIIAIAVVGWVSFWLVLTKLEPCSEPGQLTLCKEVSGSALALFALSLFLGLLGTFIGLGFGMRMVFNSEVYREHLGISIRQGLLLTLCIIGALGLQLLAALTWWSGLLLIGLIVIIELYFSSNN